MVQVYDGERYCGLPELGIIRDLCIECTVCSCCDFSLRVEKHCACVSGLMLVIVVKPLLSSARVESDSFVFSASRICLPANACVAEVLSLFFKLCKDEVNTTTANFLIF